MTIHISCNMMSPIIADDLPINSPVDCLTRSAGFHLHEEVTVTGTGSISANVIKVTGPVQILAQWAELTEVTTLVNATAVYADFWDGTNSTVLTKTTGCNISGYVVGSVFTKDKTLGEPYSSFNADECRVSEVSGVKVGQPFILIPKHGVDNFIRFHLTTTDNPVNFKMMVHFEYKMLDGGTLEFI